MVDRRLVAMREGRVPKRYRLCVRERLVVVEFAGAHSIRAANRRFGLDRKTVRAWRDRFRAAGVPGLVPRYPARRARRIPAEVVELIAYARREHRYGAVRTQIWLARVHRVRVAVATIHRIFTDLGMPRLVRPRKRRPRQLKLFERAQPGECVQVDVKFVRVRGQRRYQYTALDDCSRFRVIRLYRRHTLWSSLQFLAELLRVCPFRIRRLQTDNGTEFGLAFKLAVEEAGIEHRYTRPRRPQQNGKVERSHRIDDEEFWGREAFANDADAETKLAHWERVCNHERFSIALKGRTPVERLGDFAIAA